MDRAKYAHALYVVLQVVRAHRVVALVVQHHGVRTNQRALNQIKLYVLPIHPLRLRANKFDVVQRILFPFRHILVTRRRISNGTVAFAMVKLHAWSPEPLHVSFASGFRICRIVSNGVMASIARVRSPGAFVARY